MKVHHSYITIQADAAHSRFIRALKELPGTSGLQRQFIMEDIKLAVKQAELLKEKYSQVITGQAAVKIAHITARSVQQWAAISGIDSKTDNLITTY